MQPKKERYPLPLLPVHIWGQIASELDYHHWSLFRRVSASANEVATENKVVHSVLARFFKTRYPGNISILGNPMTLEKHQQVIESSLNCDDPLAKKLFYFCIHELVNEIRLLLSRVEGPQALIFAPISNGYSSILQFVIKKAKDPSVIITLLEYFKEYNYAEDPYFLMETFIAEGQQEWVFMRLTQNIPYNPVKIQNMLLAAAGHGDVDFLCALERHFDTQVSQLSLQRQEEGGLCTSAVGRQTQKNGTLAMIKFLFDRRNANIEDWSDITYSVNYGHYAVAEYLLAQGAPLQPNLLYHVGTVWQGHPNGFKFFFAQGAKLDQEFFQRCIAFLYFSLKEVLEFHIPISENIVHFTMAEVDRVYQIYLEVCYGDIGDVEYIQTISHNFKRQLSMLFILLAYPTELLR